MDLAARRREFPALAAPVHGQRLAYLDSAATSLMPRAAIDAVADAMTTLGNPGRGVHAMAEAATIALEDARLEIANALAGVRPSGVPGVSMEEVIFTSGTTGAINLVADTWGPDHVGRGEVVIASELEHHSNLLPWQRLCERQGAQLVLLPVDDRGRLDISPIAAHGERVKLIAIAHVSNVLGTIAPISDIIREARRVGARVLVDGAQAIAHMPVDLYRLGCDFYAFSGHKVYGPPGVGVLWVRSDVLDTMPPWQLGGGMVSLVEPTRSTYRDKYARFEAGTPNAPAIAGLRAAFELARSFDAAADEARVHAALCETIRDAGARVLGEPEIGVVSFAWDYHPHDIATIADRVGVALRSGHHCAQLVHERFGVDASTRASVGCYSGLDDVEQLARALAKVRDVMGAR